MSARVYRAVLVLRGKYAPCDARGTDSESFAYPHREQTKPVSKPLICDAGLATAVPTISLPLIPILTLTRIIRATVVEADRRLLALDTFLPFLKEFRYARGKRHGSVVPFFDYGFLKIERYDAVIGLLVAIGDRYLEHINDLFSLFLKLLL